MIVDENGMCTLDNEDKSYHSNTPRKKTNADRIRAMSDEELAELFEGNFGNMLPNTALDWLKQEVESDA